MTRIDLLCIYTKYAQRIRSYETYKV